MAEWARVLATTINEYIRVQEVNVLRNRKLLSLMKEKGRITFNHSGDKMNWKVRYQQNTMQGYADADVLTFGRQNKWKTATLDWRGYASTDSMTKKERLMNKSTEAIINVYAEMTKLLMEDITEQFGDEFYKDGNLAGNEKKLHGIESFLGNTGVSASLPIAVADDSYADLDTDLAGYGGTWTGTWPDGTGDAHYDFWSPLLVDYTSAVAASSNGWQSSTKTWPNTGTEAVRFAILYTQKNRTMDEKLSIIFLDGLLYRQYMDSIDDKERIMIQRGRDSSALVKLGFNDVINQDGTDITTEYGIPASTGYGFNVNKMELCSLQGQLFGSTSDTDIATMSSRFSIDFFGNCRYNPRNFAKLKNFS